MAVNSFYRHLGLLRFAPSVTNIFMALWEEFVFGSRPAQLVCYQRYIDDLFLIWEGDLISLQLFMSRLNGNTKNIRLIWNADASSIAFLDLEIFKHGGFFLEPRTTVNQQTGMGIFAWTAAITIHGCLISPEGSLFAFGVTAIWMMIIFHKPMVWQKSFYKRDILGLS